MPCSSCGALGAHRRLCSGSAALCLRCRVSPEHKVISEAALRKTAPWLQVNQLPEPVGSCVNCKHPAFRKQRMYLWGDVALRCLELNLPVPQ